MEVYLLMLNLWVLLGGYLEIQVEVLYLEIIISLLQEDYLVILILLILPEDCLVMYLLPNNLEVYLEIMLQLLLLVDYFPMLKLILINKILYLVILVVITKIPYLETTQAHKLKEEKVKMTEKVMMMLKYLVKIPQKLMKTKL